MRTTQPVLHIGARDLVVVAGLPGAGKSTLLHRVRIHGRARVLDPEQVADAVARAVGPLPWDVPYRAYRPLVHIVHWARFVAWGLAGSGAVLVHMTGTRGWQLTMVRALAVLGRRRHRYLWLDVEPSVAYASTHVRGRPHRPEEFARYVRRAAREPLTVRGEVTVVDREWVDASPYVVVGAPERTEA
jgi:hypothetical protein